MADTLDRAKLFRSGSVTIDDLGIADGTSGQLLATDGEGNLSFVSSADASLPVQASSSTLTLSAADSGKLITATAGGVEIPANTFNQGDVVTIYNDSASTQAVVTSAVTCRFVGQANAATSYTLGAYALVAVICVDTNTFVISGGGIQ
jgi:hypothetical protein